MRRLFSCLVLSLGLLAGAAQADMSKMYFGGGFSDASVSDTFGDDTTVGNLSLNLGYRLHTYFGLELEVGSGSDDSGSIVSDPLITYQAVMLRAGYQWNKVGLYVLAGTAMMDIDSQLIDSDSGNAIGFGINLFGSRNTSLNIHVLDLDDGAFKATTVGFHYYFGGYR